ncbi:MULTISPECIES: MmgE/PrpD family protein [unclassified Chelatococcus]|uniref:MmgE/PrpD family protein n=1 Tax=unclassified Chelatococcus TaxID=2638111 RepID=UPI001BCB14FE|nr:MULTISPECIES: MmgE/PrpD family protein [unclassified Chelatococcus]MBS7699992.1 MmgE/PrpD family protein [Chelatococcus sp. YT9]MBX3558583.1 MmgE/PrpD family protein [Chelatococcus sp.]
MSASKTIVETMATDLLALRADGLPADVIAKAKLCLCDYFSAAYEARDLPWSREAVLRSEPVRNGAASIPLAGLANPGDAAFANAVAAHGLVREDMHVGAIAHLGIVVWPALLADLAQAGRTVAGRELLAAGIVGYEAGACLGSALMTAELARLFRPTGLVGPFAAVAALCHLRGFDTEQTASALSLAVNCAAGLNQWPVPGGSDMYFHAGFAARNALVCADLARAGAFATRDIIEGNAGLFRAFARRDPAVPKPLFADGQYEIVNVFHKQAPACNFAQTPSQAALAARLQMDDGSSRVVAIRIDATEAALLYPGCDATGPFGTMLAAKMSIQFGVAAAVARGKLDASNYTDLDDPEISRLIAATTLVAAPDLTAAYPRRQPARVTLTLDDGRQIERALDDVLVATPAMVQERFRAFAAQALGEAQAGALAIFIDTLADADDAIPLNALQVPRVHH